MKKGTLEKGIIALLIVGVASAVFGGFAAWKPGDVSVGVTSQLLVPSTLRTNTTAWEAATAYTQGTIMTNSSMFYYWVTVAGTSGASEPTHTDGDATNAGVTLRYVRLQRQHLALANHGSGNVWIGMGTAAERNKGLKIPPGSTMTFPSGSDCPQMRITGISDALATNIIGVQEN